MTFVVRVKDHMVVTADAQAQAAGTGEGIIVGRRVHTVRHGQGQAAWIEQLDADVVGISRLMTYGQYGAAEHAHHANRRDFQPHPIDAVVARKWHGLNYEPGSRTVFLTKTSVQNPLQVFDDYDDRSLIGNCYIKACKQQ